VKWSGPILKEKDKGKAYRKYKQEKNKASYKKQQEAGYKANKHTNNLYSTKNYNISKAH